MAKNYTTNQTKQSKLPKQNYQQFAAETPEMCSDGIPSSVKSFTCDYSLSVSSISGTQIPALDDSSGPLLQSPVACEDKSFPWSSQLVTGIELPLMVRMTPIQDTNDPFRKGFGQ